MKLTAALFIVLLTPTICFASEPDFNKLADAIYYSEGGSKTKHPYGILSVSCETSIKCREICLKTLKTQYERFKKQKASSDYVSYLAASYAPIRAKNDPKNLNSHWQTNVNWFLKHPKEVLP